MACLALLAAVFGLSLAPPPSPQDPLAARVADERARSALFLPELPRMPPRSRTVLTSLAHERARYLAAQGSHDLQESHLRSAAVADAQLLDHRERIAALDAGSSATPDASRRRAELQAEAAAAAAKLAQHLAALVDPVGAPRYREESLYLLVDTLARQDDPTLADVHGRLAAEFPRSRFLPHADLLLAHVALAHRQPRTAQRLCERVLAGPAHELHANAALVLGWSHLRSERGEGPQPALALAAFARAIEVSLVDAIVDDHRTLRRAARDGLVHAFAAAGRVDEAAALFHRLGDTPGEHHADEMLARLALAYFVLGQHDRSAAIYRALQTLHPNDPQQCTWQVRLLLTAVAARDLAARTRETQRLAALAQQWTAGKLHLKSERDRCSREARLALAALAPG